MKMKLVDAHCDTIVKIKENNQRLYDHNGHLSIEKLLNFENPVEFFALCKASQPGDSPFGWFLEHANLYHEELAVNPDYIRHANTYQEILDNQKEGKISGILSIEGAEVLEGDMEKFQKAYELGVRNINITWNFDNDFGYSSEGSVKAGLTDLGKEMVREMNRLGMVVDVSHLSIKGFWDVCETSEKPFIASHSNAFSITPVTRNLNDDQLKALGEKKGVTGLNLCNRFLHAEGKPAMADALRHLDHMLNVAGEDCVGLGCDFDGITTPTFELTDISKLTMLHDACVKSFGAPVTEKIFYENFMRVLSVIMA